MPSGENTAPGIEPPHVNLLVFFGAVFLVFFVFVALVYARAYSLATLVMLGGIFVIVISVPLYLRQASGGKAVRHGRSYLICPQCNVRLYARSPYVLSGYRYYRRDPERHATSVLRWHLINVHHYSREDARKLAAKTEFLHDDK